MHVVPQLPQDSIDADAVAATHENGMISVTIPKLAVSTIMQT